MSPKFVDVIGPAKPSTARRFELVDDGGERIVLKCNGVELLWINSGNDQIGLSSDTDVESVGFHRGVNGNISTY